MNITTDFGTRMDGRVHLLRFHHDGRFSSAL